jgi:hypothetical protein
MHLVNGVGMKAPGSADESRPCGAEQATAGALPADGCNEPVARIGFGPEQQVCA